GSRVFSMNSAGMPARRNANAPVAHPIEPSTEPPPLTQKLARLVTLSPAETELLAEFQANPRRIARGREMIVEGRKYDGLQVLLDGVALRYLVLQDGRRQILNIVLPGDLIGFPGCFFESALYSIAALADCTVSPVPFARFLGISATHPRLGAIIFWTLS